MKRQRVTEWLEKTGPIYMLPAGSSLQIKDTRRPKAKGWKKTAHANGS